MGQGTAEKWQLCPKKGSLGTRDRRKMATLSKEGSSWDKGPPKTPNSVQRRVVLGQATAGKWQLCPKKGRLGTRDRRKMATLSKEGTSWDKGLPKTPNSVQRRDVLGQGTAENPQLCPKKGRLGTRDCRKPPTLSKEGTFWDKGLPKTPNSVQRRDVLGQGTAEKSKFCPKKDRLRTRDRRKIQTLSKEGSPWDKGPPKNPNSVQKKVVLGQGTTEKPQLYQKKAFQHPQTNKG